MVGTLLRNTLASLGCIIPFSIFYFWREQHRDVQQMKMSIIICAKQSDMKQSFLNISICFTQWKKLNFSTV